MSYYDALKVQNLIRTYRANPMMFNDDQLDELERLAADNQIEFKRTHSDFSLTRGLQQAQAGFIEGLTTLDLIPKEPRNTGEAIFRQLGHLSGFAPAIMKAPVIGLAKLGAKVTGQKTYGRFTQAALDGIDALDAVAVPMKASRFTKTVFNKGLEKTGADTFDFLKHGARTRAITEEALGLASATAVSSIWKGQDAIVDAYIGGAIAGGAFGGIGNFVSIGNLYKGTPQQVDQANKLLRAGVASAFMGIPSTLRNDPTEMQIYEYLLGGFFGYNTRPAREVEAAKWINKNRDPIEIFRPEKTEEWSKVSRDAQEYILRDHPMTMVMNKEGLGGSTGAALGYLERWAERTDRSPKFREAAVRHFKNNEINYTERDIQDYYRSKAAEIYKLNRQIIENAVLYNNGILNDDRIDIMDETEKQLFNINDISTKISNESTKLGTNRDVGVTIDKIAQRSLENDQPNVELFMRSIRSQFGEDIANKHDSQLRGWFRTRMQKPQNMDLVTLNVDGKTAEYRVIDKEKIGDVDIGEKYDIMPAQYLVPEAQFQLMSHVVREIYTTKDGKTNQEAVKIMQQELVKGEIVYALNQKDLAMVQNKLAENGRYIVHGIKDKDHVLTSRFRDEGLTLDNVFDILSNVAPRSEVEAAYKRSLAGEKQLFGDSKRTEELHERKWISNLVNMAEMNSLRIEDSWIMFDPDTNYGKSVADLNKRMSLFTNRMTPMVKQSFENVRGMPNGEKFNVIIVEDIGLKSDTDGLIEFRSDMLDAQNIAMGRDSKVTGHNKPVIAAKNELGFLATKSNGQEAFPVLNDWMMANDVHAIIYKSSAKLRGQNKASNLEYKDGNYSSTDLNKISLPIETLQISSGTYENTRKDTKGASVPMQLSGQSNEQQAFGFADIYIDKLLRPSLQGSRDGRKIVENFKKNEDVDAFAEQYNKDNIKMEELPFDFVMDILLNKPDSKIGKLLSDRLMRLEVEGALDTTSAETFEFDSDAGFKTFHETNSLLAEALRGTFVAKHTMIFNKKNYFNALRKYAVKRFSNPHIETGGKSILKGFRPEMLNYADIDPYSITQTTIVKPDSANSINIMRGSKYGNPFIIPSVYDKSPSYYKNKGFIRAGSTKEAIERYESWLRGKTDKGYMPDKRDGILNDIRSGKLSGKPLGYFKPEAKDSHAVRLVKLINEWSPRTLKEGEIYLDNGFRKMPVVLFGERYTLGEIWDMYTGKKTMPKGVKKPTQEEWNEAFTFLVIRTPADSMSGTRKLRFRGFTNQKGTGSFTHDKDNAYLGGADKDIDSIKIFQGVDKDLVKHFEKNANERSHWNEEYVKELNELFKGNASQQTIDDFMNNKIMMLSPSFRFQVARNSSTAKQGLGYGLSAKLAMQNMYDYVEANGGSVTITGGGRPTVEIKLKTDSPYKGVDAHRFFLDLGTKIVNVSADASNDPNLKSYNQFRDMLFNSIFEVKVNGKEITKYSEFTKQTKGTVFEALKMANDNIKPHQKIYDRGDTPESPTLFEVLENVKNVNRIIEQSEGVETVNPKLNRLMEEMGFKAINYKFRNLTEAHQRLYESVLGPDGLFKNAQGKFVLRDNKTAKDLADFYKIISSELSFTTPKRIQEMFSKDPDKALDFIGKEIGQYATMELLTDQYIKVQNEFAKQGRNVNTVSELLPMIKQRAYEVKELASELSRRKERDNVINNDLNGLIQSTKNNLATLERAQGLQEGMLQDYFHYWLLSPIRPLQKGKNQPQFNKAIHGSNMIPMNVKRKFYQRMDDIYDRSKTYVFKGLGVEGTETVESIKKTMKEEKPLVNNKDLFLTINKALEKKELEGLALFDSDVKEIHRFQERLETNPIFRKDFNQWYEGFTTNLGDPRDATTLKMQDIKLVNRYLDSLNKNKDIELKLAQFYQSPLTVDEVMQAKGLFGGYHKILNVPIKTSKGTVRRDVKIMMSPVGNIAHYFRRSEASMSKYQNRKHMETLKMDAIMETLSESDKVLYMDNLFSLREGRNKKGEAFTEADIDPKINRVKFDQLNKEFTKLWKRMEESWITTKDVNGNRFDWSIIDKDKQYGKINEYIRYDKNGKFDFKFFENKVLNAREQTQEIIRKVGIEGVLRYRHEYAIERALRLSDTKDPKAFREEQRSEKEFQTFRPRNYERYMHHSFRNSPEGLLVEQAEWLAKQPSDRRKSLARRMQQDNPWINTNDVLDIDPRTIMRETTKLEVDRMDESILQEQGEVPYKRSYDIVSDYQTNLIQAYHRNLMKLKAQNEIDLMIKNAKDRQMKKIDKGFEKAYFENLYKGIQDAPIESGGIPKKLRYNSYIDVWADYIRLYARDSLGYQTFISERMSTPQGRRLLHLNKKNLYWGTSDEAIIKHMEKLYQSKLGKKRNIPFFNEKSIPKDPAVRKEYFSRMIHNLGRLEAQYELLSLLANTGTWTTNMFGGATMTMGSAGAKNYAKSFSNKTVYDILLSDAKGNAVLKLLDGTKVTNRKELMTYLEERGVIDNFIKHEFEYNEPLRSGLKKAGVNIKDFQRDLIKAAKSKKGDRDESVMNVINRYGVKDLMLKTGGFLMKQSERVNRLNAFIAHGIQAVEGFKGAGKELSLADQYVFERAERGIEMTQFLYQNSHRPAFMRTSMGKVLGRFKLFVFNSVRMRKEFYKQAKLQGFKEGTESYERFKDTFAIDMMMYALGSAFMFSLFDTTLPPPWDWVQALADYTFGDKREKEMAFFGSKLGPLNVLKPPIARVPEAFGELLTGQYEDFTNYTMYTMFPFGRGIRQIKQLADDRPFRGVERAPEILFRIPYNQMKSRIERAQRQRMQQEEIEEYLNV